MKRLKVDPAALRVFGWGALAGFTGGVMIAALLVWQFGERRAPTSQATRVEQADKTPDGLGAIDEGGDEERRATGTSGTAVMESSADVDSVRDLKSRDLEIPVEGVAADELTRSFHEPRGTSRVHEALDILAPRNTPVKAVEDGKIAKLFTSKAGGITIYQFDPSEQYCYYYAHLESYASGLKDGDYVRKGQVIGYVGTSGNAPKGTPHLHFAVFRLNPEKRWWEGTPLDPFDVLQ